MTASALNPASIAPAGPTGATVSAAAGGGGVAAGFEALLAALFPQGAQTGGSAPEAAAPNASQTVPLFTSTADIDDAAAEPQADTAVAVMVDRNATDPDADAAAAIAASLMVAQPTPAEPAVTAATDASVQVPHAWGRDKAKGAPAQPAILHANPKADLAGKAELSPEAETADGDARPFAGTPAKTEATPAAAPTPPARPTAQAAQAPGPAASLPAAPPAADAAVDVAAAPPPPAAEPAPLENAPAALQAQAMAAGQAPRAEPAPQSSPRPAKAERGKGAAEATAASGLNPLEAADKPVHAKAVEGAAKTAAASVEAADTETPELEVEADAPDASLPAETRAAAQSATLAAHTTHAVRGSPETVANLAAQIVKKLEGQSTHFDLELNPQGLGKVDVRIEIGAQGQLTAAMVFDNPQAAQELKSRAAELQRALEQAGFDVSGGLSFDVTRDRGQQGQAWQDQGETNHAFRGQAFRAALETAGEVADAAAQGALRLRRGVSAGLDLRI